jgi:hypothetical protein
MLCRMCPRTTLRFIWLWTRSCATNFLSLCSRRETEDCPWTRRSMYLAEFFASILVSSKHLLLGWTVDGFDTIESMNELTNKWAINCLYILQPSGVWFFWSKSTENNNEIILLELRWTSTCRVEDLIYLFQIYQQRFIHMPSSLVFL